MHSVLLYTLLFIVFIIFISLLKVSYNSIVFLDILLLSVVLFEPSPSDIIFCCLIIFGIINQVFNYGNIKNQGFFLILIFSYIFINITGVIGAKESFQAVKFSAITFYLVLFCIFIYLYNSEERYLLIIRAYVLSTAIASILAFVAYAGFFSDILISYSYRVKGLFKDPNVFGPFIIPSVIILFDDLKERKIIKSNSLIYLILITINIIAVILSFSRAAWVNLAVASFTYLILNFKKIKVKKLLALGSIFFIIASSIWFGVGNYNLQDSFNERSKLQNYDKERFASQRAGLILASQRPLGYGPGQYENQVVNITDDSISAHNLYIRILVENGVFGFILFFTAMGYIIFILIKTHYKEISYITLKSSVLLSIILGIMVNSLVVDTLHWRHFWLFLGLSLYNISKFKSQEITTCKEI